LHTHRWDAALQSQLATALTRWLTGPDATTEAKAACCHALSMAMQREPVSFRACVVQAGSVPSLLKLLGDRSVLVVTAASGAVNALVHKAPAHAARFVSSGGVPALLAVLQVRPAVECPAVIFCRKIATSQRSAHTQPQLTPNQTRSPR
jgi:hypothetical protein